MSNIFFTSDTHFGSERTLQFSRRPFNHVREMNETLIKNWNEIVGEDDTVYHLGDFGDYETIKRLNGKVILIMGNYEAKDLKERFNNSINEYCEYLLGLGFYDLSDTFEDNAYESLQCDDKHIVLASHRPLDVPSEYSVDNEIHLFGHIHEKQMIKKRGINVGVDCHNFKPIDFDTVLFYDNALKNHYDEDVFCS